MQIKKEQLQLIIALLVTGRFSLNGDEATAVAVLKQELVNGLQAIEDQAKAAAEKILKQKTPKK